MKPEIVVYFKRSKQQPADGLFGDLVLDMIGAARSELYELTARCPHGEVTVPVLIRGCVSGKCSHQSEGECRTVQQVIVEACEQIRAAFPRFAACPCGARHWMRHGPLLATAIEGTTAAISLHDTEFCRN